MDTLLILVFIVACFILFCECSAVLLYAIPVRFVLRLLHTEGYDEQSVLVSWGFLGLWITNGANQQKITIYLGRRNIICRPIERGPKKDDEKKIPLPADFRSGERYFAFLSGMIKPAGRFVSVLWHECRFENCTGSIRIGTNDPVTTGILYGGYWASRFGLHASRIFIEMKPEFNHEVFDMDVAIRVRINHPLRIIIAGIRLMRNRAVRDMMNPEKSPAGGALQV